jgi:hypothetical protein
MVESGDLDVLLLDTHRMELVANWSGLNHEGPLRTFEMPPDLPRRWVGGPVLAFFPRSPGFEALAGRAQP